MSCQLETILEKGISVPRLKVARSVEVVLIVVIKQQD